MSIHELLIGALQYDGEDALYRAEPFLLALVEAAEGIEGELPIDQGCHDMLWCIELRDALRELRVHLESTPPASNTDKGQS